MNEIRLLEVILTLEQGGAQQLLLDKLCYLKTQGCYVCVASFEDGVVRQALEDNDIEVILIAPKHFPILLFPLFLLDLFRIYKNLKSVIEKHQINIVQTHLLSLYDYIFPFLLKNITSLKGLIWTFHNTKLEFEEYDTFSIKKPVYHLLYRRLARHTDFIVGVSDSVMDFLREDVGIPADKIITLNNALPTDRFQVDGNPDKLRDTFSIPKGTTILLTIGRLTQQKGYHYLFDALQILLEQHNIFLCVVGEGSDFESLQSYAGKLDISSHIRFLGHRVDIPFLMTSSDIFVLASLWEGLPLVILEAMASKIPIVTSDTGGISQILSDKVNCRLVPPADAASLASAIHDIINQSDQTRLYVERAFMDVQDYDISQLGQNYLRLYRKILMKADV